MLFIAIAFMSLLVVTFPLRIRLYASSKTVRRFSRTTPAGDVDNLSVQQAVESAFSSAIVQVLARHKCDQSAIPVNVPLVVLGKSGMADYQSTIAMQLGKKIKGIKPVDLAAEIVGILKAAHPDMTGQEQLFAEVTTSGPGFINMHISKGFVTQRLAAMTSVESDGRKRLGIRAAPRRERVVVDFSSPNIAKEMHVGHLRSTILGDCISRVLEFLGHDVLRLNHVGDWGTQFGMLILHLKETQQQKQQRRGKGPADPSQSLQHELQLQHIEIGDLVDFYKAAKLRFDEDATFREGARQEVVRLQAGDPGNLAAWRVICAKSRAAFQEVYRLLGVRGLEERGESFYNPRLPGLVRRLQEGGVAVESEGALCVFLQGFQNSDGTPLPLMVRKSDGGYLYATTDLAALEQRVQEERADRVIYVTDLGQAQHFAMVFQAAERAGLLGRPAGEGEAHGGKGPAVRLQHVGFGLVLGEDGKKIKSRAGDAVKLRDLLAEAVRLAGEGERGGEGEGPGEMVEGDEGESPRQKRARILGIGAVKYADLCMHRESNYRFSYAKMLAMSGNTAPYMLYALVRVRGIQRRAAQAAIGDGQAHDEEKEGCADTFLLETGEELALAKHLLRLHDVVLAVGEDLLPSKLCEYLFELSQRFNQYYEACPVLAAPSPALRRSRMHLCSVTADAMELSLQLLGLETLDRM